MKVSPVSKGQLLLARCFARLLKILSLDSRSLTLFRVYIAATTIADVSTRFADAHNHYSDSGMFPREFILRSFTNYYWLTVHMLSGAEMVMQFLFILEIIFAFCLMVGYRTKLMNILTWIMVCSVQNRNYVLGHSGDTVHRLFLFCGILLPLGRHLSVDRALECARTGKDCDELERERERERRRLVIVPAPASSKYEVVSFATALFVFQLLIMYFAAHHHKTGAEWREKGIAAWMALQLDYFRTWFGDILLIWTPGLIFGNFAVLAWQYWGSLIYFIPFYNEYWKALTCLGFTAMHVGFGMAFYLETFTWATLAACTGIIPAWVMDLTFKFLHKLFPRSITIHVVPNCKTCLAIARIMDECMLPGKSKVSVSPTPTSSASCSCNGKCHESFLGISVTDQQKNTFYGPAALGVIASHSPILFPLRYLFRMAPVRKGAHSVARFMHAHPLVDKTASEKAPYLEEGYGFRSSKGDEYEYESKVAFRPHYDTFSKDSELKSVVVDLPSIAEKLGKKEIFEDQSHNFTLNDVKDATKIGMKIAKELCLAGLLFLIVSCNIGNMNSSYGVPGPVQPIMWIFQLDQYWGMFAPRPPDITWWYNFEATLDDGTHAELFNNGAMHTFVPNIPHTWEKPNVHDSIGNHRWFKLFENGLNSHSSREEIRLYFGRWFCREYNARNPHNKVHKYAIHFMYERLDMEKLDGTRFPQAKETIWNHMCYEK